MAVPFGFSVGDFLAVLDGARKIYLALQNANGASDEYLEASERLDTIKHLIEEYKLFCSITPLEQQDNFIRKRAETCGGIAAKYQAALSSFDKDLGVGAPHGWRHGTSRKIKWALVSSISEQEKGLILELSLLESAVRRQEARSIHTKLDLEVIPQVKNISQIGTSVGEMHAQMHKHNQENWTTSRREALNWLTTLAGVFETKQHDIFDTRDRQDGLANTVIGMSEFKKWRAGKGQYLCCFGQQGIGKTVLASIIINHLRVEIGEASNAGLAFVFCSSKDSSQQTPEALISSLLHQLLCSTSILEDEVMRLYEFHKQRSTRPRLKEYAELLRSAIKCLDKVYIVIDAIDERSEANNALAQNFLGEIAQLAPANIFLTSRDLPLEICLEQQTTQLHIGALDSDISSYLQERLSSDRVPKFISEYPERKNAIISGIISKANGMFLLASLQMDSLMTKRNWRSLNEAIHTLPEKLHDAFTEIIERIKGDDCDDFSWRVLFWINYAPRQLTVDEIQNALAVRLGDRRLDPDGFLDEDTLIAGCCGLVTIQKEARVITLRHDSVREHLQKYGAKYFPNAQKDIVQTLLTYMSFDVFAQGPCECDEDIDQRIKDYPLLRHINEYLRNASDEDLTGEAQKIALRLLQDNAKVSSFIQIIHHTIIHPSGDRKERHQRFIESQDDKRAVHRLWLASYLGLTQAIRPMLERTEILEKTGYGETALHSAARSGRSDVIEILIEAGIDIHALNQSGDSAITIVSFGVSAGHNRSLQILLDKGANIEALENDGWTALHCAASFGTMGVLTLLLEKGANVEATGPNGLRPLHLAVSSGHEKVVRLLLEKGANIEATDNDGWVALHLAASSGHEGVSRLLLDKGANIEATKKDGCTAIHLAANFGNEGVLRLLLEKGANIEATEKYGRTALHLAVNSGHEGVLRLLLDKGANIEAIKNDGCTAIHLAADFGDERCLRLLLEKGANIEARDDQGFTSIHYAHHARSKENEEAILKILIDGGADVNARSKGGTSLLGVAAEMGQLEIVQLLLDNGADPYPELHFAGDNEHDKIFSMLWKKAAAYGHQMANSEVLVGFGDTKEVSKKLLRARANMLVADITLDFSGNRQDESEVEKFVRCVEQFRTLGLDLQDTTATRQADQTEVEIQRQYLTLPTRLVSQPELQETSTSGKSALLAALRVYSKADFDETINAGFNLSGIDFTTIGAIQDASFSTSLYLTLDAALETAIDAGRDFAKVRLSLTIALLMAILQKATAAQ